MVRGPDLGGKERCPGDSEVTAIRVRNYLQLVCLLVCLSLVSCTSKPSASAPDPASGLQAIPATDASRYENIRDMKSWRNPYIIVRAEDVVLYDSADNAEIVLKTDELLPALAKLPAANWPYGRVVAAAEPTTRSSEQEAVAIRKNKGIVGGILHEAHVDVKWVPGG